MTTHETVIISADDDGQRLDRWLKKQRPDLPYVLVQKLLRKGNIRINGKRARADTRLEQGAEIRMPLGQADDTAAAKKRYSIAPENIDINDYMLFIDDDIMVINKPSGLAVQGGSGLKLHLEMLLEDYVVRGVAPRLVHRLDRDTSGVLILARSAAVARKLGDAFAGREVEKTYIALVHPVPLKQNGLIDAPLAKVMVGTDLEKMQVSPEGQSARTAFRVLAKNRDVDVALVEFTPETGRTHQIRVHAAHAGFPLLGDRKYGGDLSRLRANDLNSRVYLHALRLAIPRPRGGRPVTYTAPIPDDLREAMIAFNFKTRDFE